MSMKTLFGLVIVTLILELPLRAEQPLAWPQFRGPNGSGIAEGQRPPVELGPETNMKWKVPAPSGLSSPIVVGDKLVLTAFENGKLYTIAYDRATGKEAWRAEAPAREIEAYYAAEGSPAASTPATDGDRIVSYFGSCGLFCHDPSGNELWRLEMPTAQTAGGFGSGVSPIIADGLVVLVRDVLNDPTILAVDLARGSVAWQKPRESRNSYSTPTVWETPAGKQIAAAGHARMIGYDMNSGDEKWSVRGIPSSCCPSPVTAEGLLFFAGWSPGGPEDPENQMPTFESLLKDLDQNKDEILSRSEAEEKFQGFFDSMDTDHGGTITRNEVEEIRQYMAEGRNCAFALKPGGTGDVTDSHMLWKRTKGLPYVSSAIAYAGQYVMVKDGGIVTAYDAKTGAELYQRRAIASGTYYASPVAANGHIYFTSIDGAVTVLKAGAPQPVVVAENPKLDERTAATPAIADDTMYIRTAKHLYAFAEE
jgi:outer membrane protein assembly factor BamB